jgi:eukaryotic-like serine/threonine-protein kinase
VDEGRYGSTRGQPLRPRDPRRLGEYELIGRLGEGGMGRVYLARSPVGRLVAVKVIRDALAEDDDFLRRFRGEVARAAQVPPFCTAEVLDADPDHDPPYLVVEFVDGPSLAAVVEADGPLTPANLHGLAVGMAAALTAIHGAGVIHRDLKPSNVLLAPGSPKVIDFGISRPVDGTLTHSSGNHVLGTVAYMSPERFGADSGRTLTPAADIFAWGAVVAFAGTGRVPFPADSLAQIAVRIMTDPPELIGLTGSLRTLVEQALSKDPRDRPTARQLLDRLTTHGDTAPEGDTVPLRQVPAAVGAGAPPVRRRSRLASTFAMVAGVLALAVTGGVATGKIPVPRTHRAPALAATPMPSGTSGPVIPQSFRSVIANEPLTQEGTWHSYVDGAHQGRCEISGGLLVTLQQRGPLRCKGPDTLSTMAVGDIAVFVNVTLLSTGSCAGIWFRFYKSGYLVQVCQDGMHVCVHGRPQENSLSCPYTTSGVRLSLGQVTRVGLVVSGETVRLYQDGRSVGEYDLTDGITSGHVVLGAYGGGLPGDPPYRVLFGDIDVSSDEV